MIKKIIFVIATCCLLFLVYAVNDRNAPGGEPPVEPSNPEVIPKDN